jgi:hypothetical protein
MIKAPAIVLSVGLFLTAGCTQRPTAPATAGAKDYEPVSLKMLDGVSATRMHIRVGGQDVEATVYPKDLGQSAFFLCYYTLPNPAEDTNASEAAINAEIERCVANVGAEILSRKSSPAGGYPATEVVATSARNRTHFIRYRVICTGKEIQTLTAVIPNNPDAAHTQALDNMFEQFHAK